MYSVRQPAQACSLLFSAWLNAHTMKVVLTQCRIHLIEIRNYGHFGHQINKSVSKIIYYRMNEAMEQFSRHESVFNGTSK